MQIEVRYFASLRERVGCEQEIIELQTRSSVAQVWTVGSAGFDLPGNALCAINEEYAALTDLVVEGDQVAFFPPVTGG